MTDSPSRSEIFGSFKNLSARLDFADGKIVEALAGGTEVARSLFSPVIPFGSTAGSYTGFGMLSEDGPTYPDGSNWDWNQSPVAMWPMPGIGPVSSPSLIYNNGGTSRFPIPVVQLTGTLMGALDGEEAINVNGPILVLPAWADPGTGNNAWLLTDCGGFTVRYGHYEGESTIFVTDATHYEIPGFIGEGQVFFEAPESNLPSWPEESTLIVLDFGYGAFPPSSPPPSMQTFFAANASEGAFDATLLFQDGVSLVVSGAVYGTVLNTDQPFKKQVTLGFEVYVDSLDGTAVEPPRFFVGAVMEALDPARFPTAVISISGFERASAHGQLGGVPWVGFINAYGYFLDADGNILDRAFQAGDIVQGNFTGVVDLND